MIKDFAISIIRTLREYGHQAYLCGGCVRDLLLGREPADYDITTDATPDEVMRIFPDTYAVGAQFGVVLVPLPEHATYKSKQNIVISSDTRVASGNEGQSRNLLLSSYGQPSNSCHSERFFPREESAVSRNVSATKTLCVEVATFRSDIGYSDGRHPDEVRFTKDPRQDVQRRDFTINGLLLDPLTNEVLDYVGGRKDLEAGIVRAIGDPTLRFTEDKLRMLRAVRFAARFGYVIDPATLRAIQKLAPQIHQVSRERVRDELTKMLTEGHARSAFLLLDETGLLHELLPEVETMKGVEQPPQYHPEGDVFVHTLLLLENLPHPCPPTLAWGALLHDVGKPPTFRIAPDRIRFDDHVNVGVKMAETFLRRLRFSNTDTEQILALVHNHMRFADVERMKDSTFKRFVRMPRFDEHLELHRLDCEASHHDLHSYNFTREKMAATPPADMSPEPLITGKDLIAEGYEPGPRFKEILSAVEDGQLDGHLQSKEAAMEFVHREFSLIPK
ncbi:MAG TPA: CCA tRNA nucleotidyltransferase [Terriglobales bacterium]|nr:CCA tRNA nucleotidyltransferase [Terriglobales bacterium]